MGDKNDKKLFIVLCLFSFVYSSIRLAKLSYLKHKGIILQEVSWSKLVVEYHITDIFIMIMVVGFILFLTKKMINQNYTKTSIFSIHILFAVITWILSYIIYYIYILIIGKATLDTLEWAEITTSVIDYSDRHFMFYFLNVFIIYTYYYINKSANIELQKTQLKQQLTNVQVNILKYQLHPHFFFNTLNSISSLIEIDPKLAQNTLADFSDLLRDILFLKDTNLMPLSVEMKILKRYIDIMAIRFSDHLLVTIHVENNLEDTLIPSLILQPIVENSIKHGYSYESTDLKIDIDVSKVDSSLHIEVINNGEPLSENIKYGTGLQNTIDRLKTLYDDDFVFTLENRKNDMGVITRITIPIDK